MTWLSIIIGLGLGTLVFRLIGPIAGARYTLSSNLEYIATVAAAVMLVALALVSSVVSAHGSDTGVSWARLLGVGLAGVLAWRRWALPWVVLVAAGVTAGLRFLGLG